MTADCERRVMVEVASIVDGLVNERRTALAVVTTPVAELGADGDSLSIVMIVVEAVPWSVPAMVDAVPAIDEM